MGIWEVVNRKWVVAKVVKIASQNTYAQNAKTMTSFSYAGQSLSIAEGIESMLIDPKEFDAEREYIGTPDGVLDLITGKILSAQEGAKKWLAL